MDEFFFKYRFFHLFFGIFRKKIVHNRNFLL